MPKDPSVLSMRITPQTRFQIEFIGRARGQNIQTVVARAIANVVKDAVASGEIPPEEAKGYLER